MTILSSVMPVWFLNPAQPPALVPPSAEFWPVPWVLPPLALPEPAVVPAPPVPAVVSPPPAPVAAAAPSAGPACAASFPPAPGPPPVPPLTLATVSGDSCEPHAARTSESAAPATTVAPAPA